MEVGLRDDGEFAKADYNATLYFLHEDKNYLVFQGTTYCTSLLLES